VTAREAAFRAFEALAMRAPCLDCSDRETEPAGHVVTSLRQQSTNRPMRHRQLSARSRHEAGDLTGSTVRCRVAGMRQACP